MTLATDEVLLDMFRAGRLRADLQTGRVWYYHRGRRKWYEKRPDFHPLSGRARFRIDVPGTRRATVYRNRLLFIAKTLTIPQGVVDHVDEDRHNDVGDNLRDQLPDDSSKQGYDISVRRTIELVGNWFDFVAYTGIIPPDDFVAEIPI